ncbi:MAG: T9SS type A sorting domain-containing protein [Syntrophaceae bacterium]|nr:T9SS type A sorting domain-containing protein [Syntrophaceae bacterium]
MSIKDPKDFWKKVLAEVQLEVTPMVYGTIISRTSAGEFVNDDLHVFCSDEFIKKNVERKYSQIIQEAADKVYGNTLTIKYEIKTQSHVKLNITNIVGEIVFNAVDEMKDAGVYEYHFNAANLSSGIYFYQLTAGNYQDVKKMILLR